MADINSVPEMLKLAKLIYDAWTALKTNAIPADSDELREDNESDNAMENGFDRNVVSDHQCCCNCVILIDIIK